MKPLNLLRTTALRLTLRYLSVYALLFACAGLLYFVSTRWWIDTDVEADLTSHANSVARRLDGLDSTHTTALLTQEIAAHGDAYLYVLATPDFKYLAGNLRSWPASAADLRADVPRAIAFTSEELEGRDDGDARHLPTLAMRLSDGRLLLVARDREPSETAQDLAEYILQVLAAAFALSLLMGITLGRAFLRRMDTIGHTAEAIMSGDLARRVPRSARGDEFDVLAGRLNAMLDRIQQLIGAMREVTDNVAHDLRSPLTRLRNRIEVTLIDTRPTEEYRATLRQCLEDTEGLIDTFNALLSIAQAEAGNHRNEWREIQLDRLAEDLADLYRPLAEEKGQTLDLACQAPAGLLGSPKLITQALSNLLDNAIKYTPESGRIHLAVERMDGVLEVSVRDTGPGIPAEEREHVLGRFVRLDSARNSPGNGLGLSLVHAVAKLHGAELVLGDANPGLLVRLRFRAGASEHQQQDLTQ